MRGRLAQADLWWVDWGCLRQWVRPAGFSPGFAGAWIGLGGCVDRFSLGIGMTALWVSSMGWLLGTGVLD